MIFYGSEVVERYARLRPPCPDHARLKQRIDLADFIHKLSKTAAGCR